MEVISADIGNITSIIEGEKNSILFESRHSAFTNDLVETDIFEIDDERYVINTGQFENDILKYKKKNFLNLLKYGVCKVASNRFVNLVIGIPSGQYEDHKSNLKKLIMDNADFRATINGELKKVTIYDVLVVPEGYGVYKTTSKDKLVTGAYTLVVDIGGNTTDLSLFNHQGKFLEGKSIKQGLIDMYTRLLHKVSDFGINSIVDVKNYFDGELRLIGVSDTHKEEPRKETYTKIMNDLKGLYPSIAQYNVILCGGGAEVFEEEFLQWLPHTIVEKDITLTSKSGKVIGDAKFG